MEHHVVVIKDNHELPVRLEDNQDMRVKLVEGYAEIFGFPLTLDIPYRFPEHSRFAISTRGSGGQLQVGVTQGRIPLNPRPNLSHEDHWKYLEELKIFRASSARTRRGGPRVILVGATDRGKTSFGKFLLNHAVNDGLTPTFVDLDVSQGSISLPGTLSMVTLNRPLHPLKSVEYLNDADTRHFGYTSLGRNPALAMNAVRELAEAFKTKCNDSSAVHKGGCIISTCGWSYGAGLDISCLAVLLFEVTHVVVITDRPSRLCEKIREKLSTDFPDASFKKVHFRNMTRCKQVVKRDGNYRKASRHLKVNEYFNHICYEIQVPLQELNVFREAGISSSSSHTHMHGGGAGAVRHVSIVEPSTGRGSVRQETTGSAATHRQMSDPNFEEAQRDPRYDENQPFHPGSPQYKHRNDGGGVASSSNANHHKHGNHGKHATGASPRRASQPDKTERPPTRHGSEGAGKRASHQQQQAGSGRHSQSKQRPNEVAKRQLRRSSQQSNGSSYHDANQTDDPQRPGGSRQRHSEGSKQHHNQHHNRNNLDEAGSLHHKKMNRKGSSDSKRGGRRSQDSNRSTIDDARPNSGSQAGRRASLKQSSPLARSNSHEAGGRRKNSAGRNSQQSSGSYSHRRESQKGWRSLNRQESSEEELEHDQHRQESENERRFGSQYRSGGSPRESIQQKQQQKQKPLQQTQREGSISSQRRHQALYKQGYSMSLEETLKRQKEKKKMRESQTEPMYNQIPAPYERMKPLDLRIGSILSVLDDGDLPRGNTADPCESAVRGFVKLKDCAGDVMTFLCRSAELPPTCRLLLMNFQS